jgi:hypothetical protein
MCFPGLDPRKILEDLLQGIKKQMHDWTIRAEAKVGLSVKRALWRPTTPSRVALPPYRPKASSRSLTSQASQVAEVKEI